MGQVWFEFAWIARSLMVLALVGLTRITSLQAMDPPETPFFDTEVMAVLSKSGCNMGACHGNQNGKGGFKLSLRGQDPTADYHALTRDIAGRRSNAVEPETSLVLMKATMQVAHEGGLRFLRDSIEYRVLHDWIAAGAKRQNAREKRLHHIDVDPKEGWLVEPKREVTLRVTAHFTNGTSQDVTPLTVFESSSPEVQIDSNGVVTREGYGESTVVVRYLSEQFPVRIAWIANRPAPGLQTQMIANPIDKAVFGKLAKLRITPSAICDDATFLRRISLDVTGRLPSAAQARAFFEDNDLDKRNRVIEHLLSSSDYANWWALKLSDMLRNEEKTLDRKGVQNFHSWLREAIDHDLPYNRMVEKLVASQGSTYQQPEANYYRALRDALSRSEATAQLFLGIRLQCAKCHNHPFDKWTQDDYYSWGNVFSRVGYKILENQRRDQNDSHEFDGEQIVYSLREGDLSDPRTGRPRPPRLLGESIPLANDQDRLSHLARWLTSGTTPQIARVWVNRVWSNLTGRGIIEPVDDFRVTNPPSNPELLEALTNEFVSHGWSTRHLIRTIVSSQTYQLSAIPNPTNRDDEINFSKARTRRLTAEQLLDAFASIAGLPLEFSGYPIGMGAAEIPGVRAVKARQRVLSNADQFLKDFGKPARLQSCECERGTEATLNQAFQLVSGELLDDLLTRRSNRIGRWIEDRHATDQEIVSELFWMSYARPPNKQELMELTRRLSQTTDRRKTLEDLAWSVLNSNEFLLQH